MLGVGRWARVLRAFDLGLGCAVALKVVPTSDREATARLRWEAALLSTLSLPSVPRFRGWWEAGATACLALELIEGECWPPPGPLSWAAVRAEALSLAEALGRLHGLGVVHRDLSPANLRHAGNGPVWILDFGLATEHVAAEPSAFVGTPRYMAPESVVGGPTDARVDVYAVGVLLYEVLSGAAPHPGDDASALRARLLEPAEPLGRRCPEVPGPVAACIDRMLAIDPAARPINGRAVFEALFACGEGASGREGVYDIGVLPLPGPDPTWWRGHFAGPPRFLHLQEDAAAHLRDATGEDAARAGAVLAGWLASDMARLVEGRVLLTREQLGVLHDLPLPDAARRVARGDAERLHGVLALLSPGAPPGALGATLGWRDEHVMRTLLTLEGSGGARRVTGGWVAAGAWPNLGIGEDRRLAARAVAALPPDHPAALRIAVMAGNADALGAAARARCQALLDSGDPRSAVGLARRLEMVRPGTLLPEQIAVAALSAGTVDVLGEVATRLPGPTGALLRAAAAIVGGAVSEGLERLDRLGPLDEAVLEEWRLGLSARGRVITGDPGVLSWIDGLEPWSRDGTDDRHGRWLSWRGSALYWLGRFEEAARTQETAAGMRRSRSARLAGQLNAAAGWLDLGDLTRTERVATEAEALAATLRHGRHEAEAAWMIRAVRYRRGERLEVDEEAVASLPWLVDHRVTGPSLVVEAAVAWRGGDRARARTLATASSAAFVAAGRGGLSAFPAVLAWQSAEHIDLDAAAALVERARALPPRLSAQALALVARQAPSLVAREWVRLPPDTPRPPQRLELLDADEVSAYVIGTPSH